MLILNDYGYRIEERRTDHPTPPPLDTPYARYRYAETLLSRHRMTKSELAKYIDIYPRSVARMLDKMCLAIPLTQDEYFRWYVLGTQAERDQSPPARIYNRGARTMQIMPVGRSC
jgi:hypothetical protein